MALIVRHVQTYRPENWDRALAGIQRWIPIGRRLGIPKDNFCRYISGADGVFTLVNQREYDSLEAWQAALDKMMGDPENQALAEEANPLVEDWRIELLFTLDLE